MNTALIFMLGGGLGGAALVAVDGVRRSRAKVRRVEHLQELRSFARRRGVSPLENAVPDHVYDRATPRGMRQRNSVDDVLLGRDERGNYYTLRRSRGRQCDQLLVFDAPKDTQIDGFSAEPYLKQNRLPAIARLLRRDGDTTMQLRSNWDCEPRALLEDGIVHRCSRALQLVARHANSRGSMPLALDVDGRRVCIRAKGKLDVDDLNVFLDAALTMRSQVLDILMDVRHLRSLSGDIQPITDAVHQVVENALKADSITIQRRRTSTPVERKELLERQSGPWSTVMDVPAELLRRPTAPVEEEVVVLTGRGTPL